MKQKLKEFKLVYESLDDLYKSFKNDIEDIELEDEQLRKLPEVLPGDVIKTIWNGVYVGTEDYGYVIVLPEMALDEGQWILHVPNPENPGGIGDVEDIWIHSYELAMNPYIDKIINITKRSNW
jgi:hypothetical protein